jgi:uncharacterized OB-fold protein
MTDLKKKEPLKEGLWIDERSTGGSLQLIGCECTACGELFFGQQALGFCSYCQSKALKQIRLSPRGVIYSHTVVMQRPPGYYQGPVPYAMGFVELPEGLRVQTLFTDCDFDTLKVGMAVELVLRTLHTDESGKEIETYMFRPTG